MFYFIFENVKSLIKGVHIAGDVITLYIRDTHYSGLQHKSRSVQLSQPSISTVITQPRQTNKACRGLPYRSHDFESIEHTLKKLHPKELPEILSENDGHFHMSACTVIKPDELIGYLNQIKDLQANTTRRLKLLNTKEVKYDQMLTKNLLGIDLQIDIENDLIDSLDIEKLSIAYQKYYRKNEKAIHKNFNSTREILTKYWYDHSWLDETLILANTAWRSAKQSAMISFTATLFDEVLQRLCLAKIYVEILNDTLNFCLMAFLSSSYYPLFVSTMVLTLMQLYFGKKTALAETISHILGIVTSVVEEKPLDGFGLLNFCVSLLSSTASYTATQALTRYSVSAVCNKLGFAANKPINPSLAQETDIKDMPASSSLCSA